jgi:hypothetical protein
MRLSILLVTALVSLSLLPACGPATGPAQAAEPAGASPPAPAYTTTSTPTRTPVPSPTARPPDLPPGFHTDLLNPLDAPQAYLRDACQYLNLKWKAGNAAPGTVVMTIMFHSITRGEPGDPNQVSEAEFARLMEELKEQGFAAITSQQLADFLERNAWIPPRSVLLLVDDRRFGQYYDVHFRPYYQQWGWPVVNAWISAPYTSESLWQQMVDLHHEGWVDFQAHGVVHNIPIGPYSSEEYMRSELFGPLQVFEERFGKRPIAYIWPGGGFTPRAIEIAREAGYRLGFTVNPRGPVMFNWVPQADEPDPRRPSYIPEGPGGDPLMTLPRYWPSDARLKLETVVQIGEQAAAHAGQVEAAELAYYDIVCAPAYGPLDGP